MTQSSTNFGPFQDNYKTRFPESLLFVVILERESLIM